VGEEEKGAGRPKPLDANTICSYNVHVDENRFSTDSILDIMDRNAYRPWLEEVPKPCSVLAKSEQNPVNFLYMGLFLGFKKFRSHRLTYA
jgi:hypothetical protein